MKSRKLIFDARHISNEFSGLGRYSFHLLEGLKQHIEHFSSVIVLVEEGIAKDNELFKKLEAMAEKHEALRIYQTNVKTFSFQHYFSMHKLVNEFSGYQYFYPHFDFPFRIKLDSQLVIHDLFPLVVKGYMVNKSKLKKVVFYLLCTHSLISNRRRIIAISDSTRKDISRYFPFIKRNKVRTVLSSDCLLDASQQAFTKRNDNPYLFYVGDRRPHKNIKKMIDVFLILKSKYGYKGDFIIAGTVKNFDFNVEEYIQGNDSIKLVGPVSDSDLLEYYSSMDALFFLSKYEGFGLPVLEAARLNRKIITSNLSSLPEVCPDSALMLDPYAENEYLSEVIISYLSSTDIVMNDEFLQKFSWASTAQGIFFGS